MVCVLALAVLVLAVSFNLIVPPYVVQGSKKV